MERLTTVLLAHRRLVLAVWALLIMLGGVFAAGLPSRIVPGGEAPASSQSEVWRAHWRTARCPRCS